MQNEIDDIEKNKKDSKIMNYTVFDLETDGLGISYLSVIQASGILINDDLQILDSFDLKSRLIKGKLFNQGNLYKP